MKIGVTSPSFSKSKILCDELNNIFDNISYNHDGVKLEGKDLITFAKDCDALVVGLDTINEEVIKSLPKLKFISKYGVGLDGIDQIACKNNNISIGWTGGVNKRSASEMTLGFMITLIRNMYPTSLDLRSSTWNKSGGKQLSGKTIGIIGLGNIGLDLIDLLTPFKCEILGNDIIPNFNVPNLNFQHVSKEEIYVRSDIITVHTPLDDSTYDMIGSNEINKMKDGVILINAARGGIINESDLYKALKEKKVGAAAIDVFQEEPPFESPLLELNNVFSTPHIGGNAFEAVLAMGRSAINHLRKEFNV